MCEYISRMCARKSVIKNMCVTLRETRVTRCVTPPCFENDGGLFKVDLSLDLRKTSELTLPKPNEMLKADRKADLFDGKKIHVGVGYDIPVWRERDVTLV